MEGDAGRDANKSFGHWAGLVTLRETENLKNICPSMRIGIAAALRMLWVRHCGFDSHLGY